MNRVKQNMGLKQTIKQQQQQPFLKPEQLPKPKKLYNLQTQ